MTRRCASAVFQSVVPSRNETLRRTCSVFTAKEEATEAEAEEVTATAMASVTGHCIWFHAKWALSYSWVEIVKISRGYPPLNWIAATCVYPLSSSSNWRWTSASFFILPPLLFLFFLSLSLFGLPLVGLFSDSLSPTRRAPQLRPVFYFDFASSRILDSLSLFNSLVRMRDNRADEEKPRRTPKNLPPEMQVGTSGCAGAVVKCNLNVTRSFTVAMRKTGKMASFASSNSEFFLLYYGLFD